MYILIILLLTTEGFKVKKIDFHGNRFFSDKKLKEIINTSEGELYDEFQAHTDRRRIINFYHNRGFKYIKITDWSKTIVDFEHRLIRCDIYIEEGVRQYITEIKFDGNEVFSDDKLLKLIKLSPGSPVDNEQIFLSKYKIADFYAEQGYAYAEVEDKITELVKDTLCANVALTFQIKENGLVRFGTISLEGHRTVRDGIITREIIFKEGDVYSPKKLHLCQARIYGTDLFESVKFKLKGITDKQDTVDVVFLVKERAPRWISFGSGYSSPDRAWFDAGWGHSNLWNNGQKLSINCKYELNPFRVEDLQKVEVTLPYREPYLLNTSFKGELSPFYKLYLQDKEPFYQLSYVGAQGRLGKYIGRYTQSFLSYNYEVVDKKGTVPEISGIINSLIFSISYDTRTDIFYPRMGGLQCFSYEYAGLGGDYKFRKFEVDGSLVSRFLHTTIVTRLKFGGIFGEVPLERRFVLGGVNTIRGYPDMMYEDIMEERKNWILLFNLEFRIPIGKTEAAYFIDAGNVWWAKEDIRIEDVKLGSGFGLRYRTPIGPIRLDYGRRMIAAESTKGRVYFGIGYMF